MTIHTKTASSTSDGEDADPLLFRTPNIGDGVAIQQLIAACPPLDQNSTYVYLLLCSHFSQSCIVVQHQDRIVGFISAYIHPQKPNTLFVWQVAVHESMRGHGLAQRMLDQLLLRPHLTPVIRYVETTVDPANEASRRVFTYLAQRHQTAIKEVPFFEAKHFVEPQVEPLLCIGPLHKTKAKAKDKANN